MTVMKQLQDMADDQARETYRRIMVESLTQQAARYRATARATYDASVRKNSPDLREEAQEALDLATTAERIRDEIKEA